MTAPCCYQSGNKEICLLRSHISGKLTWMGKANLQKSLIFCSFAVVLKEPHPLRIADCGSVKRAVTLQSAFISGPTHSGRNNSFEKSSSIDAPADRHLSHSA